MGHKEDLLAGAKKMLLERGYAKTTARDIVAASHTNLASIGYHFGSKDALMVQAIIELTGEWGERFAPAALRDADLTSAQKFLAAWERLTKLYVEDRQLLVASYEVFGQIERIPELRAMMHEAWELVRADMAFDFLSLPPDIDRGMVRALGSVLLALLSGLSLQYTVDPNTAPTARDIAMAIRFIGLSLAGRPTETEAP